MFVYIPRYAYKITSGYHGNGTITIDIAFINQSNQDKDGKTYTYVTTYPGAENGAMKDYVVHPAFTNDPSIGGWNENLNGFWVAKFEARVDENTKEQITFKPNMSMSHISSLNIAKFVNSLIQMEENYNISSSNMHLLKNSEWGAVAYLTQSEYGNTEMKSNTYNYETGVTQSGEPYNTPNGQETSSTRNVYGVYDLEGGFAEYVAAYVNSSTVNTSYKESLNAPYLRNEYKMGTENTGSANFEANQDKWGDAIWEIFEHNNDFPHSGSCQRQLFRAW